MILLFGSTGYIGSEFKKQISELDVPFLCWKNSSKTRILDLIEFYKSNRFKIIINAAGYTGKPNVDICEYKKNETILGNVTWPQMITNFCEIHDIKLCHISSGCIFSGRRSDGGGFTEDDEPNFSFQDNNCSFYSGTKCLSEKLVRCWEKSYLCRLRIPFEENNNPRNFLTKLLTYPKLLKAENSISNKQEFVRACLDLVLNNRSFGTYNIVNTGSITTEQIIEKLKLITKKKFEFIDEDEFYSKYAFAPRSNCVMDNTKLLNTGIKMSSVEESIDYCINNWSWN